MKCCNLYFNRIVILIIFIQNYIDNLISLPNENVIMITGDTTYVIAVCELIIFKAGKYFCICQYSIMYVFENLEDFEFLLV